MNISVVNKSLSQRVDQRVADLLSKMTLAEKIGQMSQVSGHDARIPDHLKEDLKNGRVGSVLNEVDLATLNEMQRICMQESRLKIPLLIGRDVIHGFKTIFPIPLGQAASWDPAIIERGARISAIEAAATGVNWTFAPMIDITRDPRWGRIAEEEEDRRTIRTDPGPGPDQDCPRRIMTRPKKRRRPP